MALSGNLTAYQSLEINRNMSDPNFSDECWEGDSKGRGYMYPYSWGMLLNSRKEHNTVK